MFNNCYNDDDNNDDNDDGNSDNGNDSKQEKNYHFRTYIFWLSVYIYPARLEHWDILRPLINDRVEFLNIFFLVNLHSDLAS